MGVLSLSIKSENKGADQLRGYRGADLRICFRRNICETVWPKLIKIDHAKSHCGGENFCLGFGRNRIKTLVSMATDIMEKCHNNHDSSFIFGWICFIVAGNKDRHEISDKFDIGQFAPSALELSALGIKNSKL